MSEKARLHFCRIYLLDVLQKFPSWHELAAPTQATQAFVWSDFRVTATPFADAAPLHDGTHPEWREFCRTELGLR